MQKPCIFRSDSLSPLPDYLLSLLRAPKVVVIGEHHSTKEIPAMVSRFARTMMEDGTPIALCLEIVDHYNQDLIDQYKESGEEKHLEAMPHFKQNPNGANSTEAIAKLIMEFGKAPYVDVLAFDAAMENWPAADENGRDIAMASNLAEIINSKKYEQILVLTGNVHSSKVPIKTDSQVLIPMCFELCKSEMLGISCSEIFSVFACFEKSDCFQDANYDSLSIGRQNQDMDVDGVCFYRPYDEKLVHGHDAILHFKEVTRSPSYL